MNESERAELEQLKLKQAQLESDLRALSTEITSLTLRLGWEEVQGPRSKVQSLSEAPPPELTAEKGQAEAVSSPWSVVRGPALPPPIPPVIAQVAAAQARPAMRPAENHAAQDAGRDAGAPRSSFEMRLGTYWLVRIGIVMVLTGLVFFGNLAYHNYISKLGPGGKLTLLYVASGLLLGAGAWWQRRAAKESLKNYAQVLFAGGLAAVYFTTYAAYHVAQLKVIESPVLDGLLLLAWAGFMVWIADRKKSEVLALFAVGLAYYTSIITHAGSFTLWSNLVLTSAAVVFLIRNRWAALSFASLIASYAAYAFWRFFDGESWHWATPEQGLWMGALFLMSYWLVFTVAVFASRDEKFAGQNRVAFLTFNNGAFFSLFLLTMLQVQTGGFWKFCVIYGSVLLVLAVAAARFLNREPLAKNFYLTQGLLLITVGFIVKFAGMQLALILAAESVILLMVGSLRKNFVLLTGAYLSAGLSIGWGMDGMKQFDTPGLWLGIGLGVLMVWNAVWAGRERGSPTRSTSEAEAASEKIKSASTCGPAAARRAALLRPGPAYFSTLALLIWLIATWDNTGHANFPLVLAGEALLITFSIYLLRLRELIVLGQSYVILAAVAWLGKFASELGPPPPWWNPVGLILCTLVLGHWWTLKSEVRSPKSKAISDVRSRFALGFQAFYSLAIISVLYCWLHQQVEPQTWLALTSGLAVGLTAYAVLTRLWFLAASGQLFLLASCIEFALQLARGKPAWPLALAPIAALALLSGATVKWFEKRPDASGRIGPPLLEAARVYRWAALVLATWWICEYISEPNRVWLLALFSAAAFLWGGLRRNNEALLFSAGFAVPALFLFWLPLVEGHHLYWGHLLLVCVLLAQQQAARRFPDRFALNSEAHAALILIGGLCLWRFLSVWVAEPASGFYLTAGWSALALVLFAAGIALHERMYRWLGLGILACALGRVVVFDVWQLEMIYRVLSFMALGIVLLVLGFIYNKYQEKIKEWL